MLYITDRHISMCTVSAQPVAAQGLQAHLVVEDKALQGEAQVGRHGAQTQLPGGFLLIQVRVSHPLLAGW